MKRTYITPSFKMVRIKVNPILAASIALNIEEGKKEGKDGWGAAQGKAAYYDEDDLFNEE